MPASVESARSAGLAAVRRWMREQGWTPFAFQEETWRHYLGGECGLIHAATGTGKTYALWLAALAEALDERAAAAAVAPERGDVHAPGDARARQDARAHEDTRSPGSAVAPEDAAELEDRLEGAAVEGAAVARALPPSRRLAVSRPAPGRRPSRGAGTGEDAATGLRLLWITPLRALANDLVGALRAPLADVGLGDWTVEGRTGDTASSLKVRQRDRPPTALVTTPESLAVLLSYPESRQLLGGVRTVVVDEWHELLGSKRGSQLELALARLRAWSPGLRTWGLSATLANLDEAARGLVGTGRLVCGPAAADAAAVGPARGESPSGDYPSAHSVDPQGAAPASAPRVVEPVSRPVVISGDVPKPYVVETIVPRQIARFPWAGHLGLRLVPEVLEVIEGARSTLLFTNVRSQAEAWYQAIVTFRPEWSGVVALHHGSIDRAMREQVEEDLRRGKLRCVVCTSSLDLGVDFTPVDQVIQIGSPKGIARLLQRAGRSGHRPGEESRVVCVPTHAFELVEFAAARAAMAERAVEPRRPLDRPLDVLVQHLVTLALGGGFEERALYDEVRTTVAFAQLSPEEWRWALEFVTHGGPALRAYPEYARLVERDGWFHAASTRVARLHRLSIGTIVGDPVMQLQYLGGRKLGTIEESFIARLRPGDRFVFAGRVLRLVRVRDMTALVRLAPGGKGEFPRWYGARLSFSTQLGEAVKRMLAREGRVEEGTSGGVDEGAVRAPGTPSPSTFASLRSHGRRSPDEGSAGAPAADGLAIAQMPERSRGAPAAQVVHSSTHALPHSAVSREMLAVQPLLALQSRWSRLPRPGALLLERTRSRDGHHAYFFPFEGRAVHEGISALLAYRLARQAPRSITVTSNDYGFELLSAQPLPDDPAEWRALLSPEQLLEDLLASLNAAELDRRQFREIARVAGLVFPGYPGMPRSARQLQASSGLMYDVFARYDPGNLLLAQARREVLDRQLEVARIRQALERMAGQELELVVTERLTPLAFPLWADRIQAAHVSTEKWTDRVRRMAASLEKAASRGARSSRGQGASRGAGSSKGQAATRARGDGGRARRRDGRTGRPDAASTVETTPDAAARREAGPAGHPQARRPVVSPFDGPRRHAPPPPRGGRNSA